MLKCEHAYSFSKPHFQAEKSHFKLQMALDILSSNKNSCNRGFIGGFTEVFQHSLDLEVAPLDRCFLNIQF